MQPFDELDFEHFGHEGVWIFMMKWTLKILVMGRCRTLQGTRL